MAEVAWTVERNNKILKDMKSDSEESLDEILKRISTGLTGADLFVDYGKTVAALSLVWHPSLVTLQEWLNKGRASIKQKHLEHRSRDIVAARRKAKLNGTPFKAPPLVPIETLEVEKVSFRGIHVDIGTLQCLRVCAPVSKTLKTIHFWRAGLTVEHIEILAKIVSSGSNFSDNSENSTSRTSMAIRNLKVEWNPLVDGNGDDLSTAFTQLLLNDSQIFCLSLRENNISAKGCKSLANALIGNKLILELNLSHNCIGNEGVKALSEALYLNRRLQRLSVCHNSIDGESALTLIEPLLSKKLPDYLVDKYNEIRENNVEAEKEALKEVTALMNANKAEMDAYTTEVENARQVHNKKYKDQNDSPKFIPPKAPIQVPILPMGFLPSITKKDEETGSFWECATHNNVINEIDLSANKIGNACETIFSKVVEQTTKNSCYLKYIALQRNNLPVDKANELQKDTLTKCQGVKFRFV